MSLKIYLKKITVFIFSILVILGISGISNQVYAYYDIKSALNDINFGLDPGSDPEQTLVGDLIGGNLNWFVSITGIIAVAFLIYGGVLFITAGGDEQRLQKAISTIRNALIGLVLILLSGLIINFIFNRINESTV